MTPPNRVFNAHILHDPILGYYWLDEHSISSPSPKTYHTTKMDACKDAISHAQLNEYHTIILRGDLIAPRLRNYSSLLSTNKIKVKIAGRKGKAMQSGRTIYLWLNDDLTQKLTTLINHYGLGEVKSPPPHATVICKLIDNEYNKLK